MPNCRPLPAAPGAAPQRRPPSPSVSARGGVAASCALAFAFAFSLAGCDPDCVSPSRIDGEWTVQARSTDDAWRVSGFNSDEDIAERTAQGELLSQVLANGERQWTLKYVPGNDAYNLTIDGQRFVATAKPASDNCNQLALRVEGSWEGDEGSEHDFALDGALLWTGDDFAGTFSYSDAWTWDERSGEVRLPAGELLGSAGAPDAG